jgi:hypothetical protein
MVRPVKLSIPYVNSKRVQPAENFILAMPGPNLSRLFQGAVSPGEENRKSLEVIENYGGPGVSRTRDLRFRKPLLYPSELRGLNLLYRIQSKTHYITTRLIGTGCLRITSLEVLI